MKDKPVLTKVTKGGYITYKYTGPKNKDIQYFLEDLYAREGAIKSSGYFYRLNAWNKKIDKFFERYFPWNCIDGPLAINKDSLLLFCVMLGAAIFYAAKIQVKITFPLSEHHCLGYS